VERVTEMGQFSEELMKAGGGWCAAKDCIPAAAAGA
jgi:hypothetical protein